eukprot:TRINITY_DN1100_c0_g1_i1.p1 TRINITY_DN1100_c0_g1~~TRINITY_DN1100_c0_g1_i1.p1  ORF type:complete len:529 (-),score=63.10 TRINITY_DN1100_c0_g1_i1:133-1719(-)
MGIVSPFLTIAAMASVPIDKNTSKSQAGSSSPQAGSSSSQASQPPDTPQKVPAPKFKCKDSQSGPKAIVSWLRSQYKTHKKKQKGKHKKKNAAKRGPEGTWPTGPIKKWGKNLDQAKTFANFCKKNCLKAKDFPVDEFMLFVQERCEYPDKVHFFTGFCERHREAANAIVNFHNDVVVVDVVGSWRKEDDFLAMTFEAKRDHLDPDLKGGDIKLKIKIEFQKPPVSAVAKTEWTPRLLELCAPEIQRDRTGDKPPSISFAFREGDLPWAAGVLDQKAEIGIEIDHYPVCCTPVVVKRETGMIVDPNGPPSTTPTPVAVQPGTGTPVNANAVVGGPPSTTPTLVAVPPGTGTPVNANAVVGGPPSTTPTLVAVPPGTGTPVNANAVVGGPPSTTPTLVAVQPGTGTPVNANAVVGGPPSTTPTLERVFGTADPGLAAFMSSGSIVSTLEQRGEGNILGGSIGVDGGPASPLMRSSLYSSVPDISTLPISGWLDLPDDFRLDVGGKRPVSPYKQDDTASHPKKKQSLSPA